VAELHSETSQVIIKFDQGGNQPVLYDAKTLLQRIPPGEKDLKKAVAIPASEIAVGDRVLVTIASETPAARRILVMPATDIAKSKEADRLDWAARGVSGVVAEKNGNQVTLRMRSMMGETKATVTIPKTATIKRYAPDSVRFADARGSKLEEVSVGDQLRARGDKSPDGATVNASEVVFGTFQTKAGKITAVNPDTGEVTLAELNTNATIVAKATHDSQLKAMPDFAAMMGGGGPPPGMAPGGMPAGGPPPGGMPGGPPRGGPPDMSQMMERMPAVKLQDLKPGQTVVVSSTKGAVDGHITIITMLANAEMLIRMASMQGGAQGAGRPAGMPAGGMQGGMMGGMSMGGLDLPGMMP